MADDPIARWAATAAAIDAAMAVASANDVLPALTGEVLAHTWDLAKAIGVDPQLDTDLCEVSYGFLQSNEEQVRASGLFGAAAPVPSNADAAAQLIAFVGRDPGWTN